MLNAREYRRLVGIVESYGAHPLTDHESYLRTHHIPNWCQLLADFTPETVVLPNGTNVESELKSLGWDTCFVKDYVKSLPFEEGSEVRYFVLDGKSYGPQNSDMPSVVYSCAERIDLHHPIFSVVPFRYVDTKETTFGDGQVSDLVGWEVERFVEVWKASHA